MTPIKCSWEAFKQMAEAFRASAPGLSIEALDNAWRQFGLAYIGMDDQAQERSAAILYTMGSRVYMACEAALLSELETA